jgi:rhamnogalacturonan lyase-like protein
MTRIRLPIIILLTTSLCLHAAEVKPKYFDHKDTGKVTALGTIIPPWKTITLDAEYGGQWVVAADLDNDGQVEIVSCENFNQNDVHYTSTAVAQELDGNVLWHWGQPEIGRKIWHHDVACQIHDWDNNGNKEVVLCTRGFLIELDGKTGKEKRRIAIPKSATDCVVFCDLSGKNYPSDVLVKDRYHNIYAYNQQGKRLWSVKDPGGHRTAHQPRPIDLDNDGRDEIAAGYAMLNADGSVRWVYKSQTVDQTRGHLDCLRVLKQGKKPEDFRLALTCCGANNIAMIDGNGKILWEVAGRHFESIDIGRVIADHPGQQLLVDIDHQPWGNSPMWVMDENGKLLGQIVTNYSRHHALLDWTGDGVNEILVGNSGTIYNQQGKRIATLTPSPSEDPPKRKGERSLLIGDMSGDGIPDVLLATPTHVHIFLNRKGKKANIPLPLGTEFNFTLY